MDWRTPAAPLIGIEKADIIAVDASTLTSPRWVKMSLILELPQASSAMIHKVWIHPKGCGSRLASRGVIGIPSQRRLTLLQLQVWKALGHDPSHEHRDVVLLPAGELAQLEPAILERRPHELLPPGQVEALRERLARVGGRKFRVRCVNPEKFR